MKYKLLILLLFFCVANCFATTKRYKAWTQDISNTEISVLTCSPGDQIYSIFGHTAIRVSNPNTGLDAVVNYGLFDFNQDSFVFRFVKGETDYSCGAEHFSSFLYSYAWRGSGVKGTVLDLNDDEKERIIRVLTHDLKPENSEYRYNFVYNNCATKIRDIIKFAYSGKYESLVPSEYTFREIIGKYAENYPWYMFSFDICLGGKEYNTLMTPEEAQFLPEHLDKAINNSLIGRDGEEFKSKTRQEIHLMPKEKEIEKTLFTPMVMACILLLLSIINLFFGKKCRIASNIYSGTILLTYTLIGVIVTFLMFFSEHPFTSANVNICIFNPLLIIPFVGLMIKEKKKYLRIINVVFILLAVFFILYSFTFWSCVNHAFIPLALVLIIELGVYLQ
ncbi:MAG: DUF4105 domain-containing protein [Paludibacteraceae bacterium]|nr:DUF4105 domain-containing protein [Paludibacteraceae bacterium]